MNKINLSEFTNNISFPFFIQYGYHSGNVNVHKHADFTELVIVLDGKALHVVGDDVYTISKGDVFVIGPNTNHEFKDSVDFIPCNIMFRPSFFFEHIFQMKESSGFHALFYLEPYMNQEGHFKSRLKLNYDLFLSVHELTDAMLREYESKQVGYQEIILAKFLELIVSLSRNYNIPNLKSGDSSDALLVAYGCSYIETHFKEQFTLDDVAKVCGLSKRHFSRIFKETYKVSPIQYLIELRLVYASKRIERTNDSITSIAYESGFSDNNYFSRKFKQFFHLTPHEYRKIKRNY